MSLVDYIRIIRQRWTWIVAGLLVGLLVGLGLSMALPKSYTASTRLFFTVAGGSSVTDVNIAATFTSGQMTSFGEVATSPIVLDPVIRELGLQESPQALAQDVTVTIPEDTVVMQINASRHDPAEAAQIANAIAHHLGTAVTELAPTNNKGNPIVSAEVISDAAPPTDPSAPNAKMLLGVSTFAGLLLGIGLAVVLDASTRARRAT